MVIQDSKGYMWFATDRGVARFDGYRFKVFTTREGLCDNSVLGLYEDYRGRIWFYTYSNQLSYFENDKIHNLKANRLLKESRDFGIPCSMAVDSSDTIWMGFRGTPVGYRFLKITDEGELQREKLKTKTAVKPSRIYVKQFSNGEYIWGFKSRRNNYGITLSGFNRPDATYLNTSNVKEVFYNREVGFSLFQKPGNDFLFSYHNCIYEYARDTVSFRFCSNDITTFGLYEDQQKNIWVATFDGGVQVFRNNSFNQPAFTLLKNKIVSWIANDNEGGVWMTTLNDGIYYVPSIHFREVKSSEFFENQRIADIDGSPGELFVGFYQGGMKPLKYTSELRITPNNAYLFSKGSRVFVTPTQPDYLIGSGVYSKYKPMTYIWHRHQLVDSIALFYSLCTSYSKEEIVMVNGQGLTSLNLRNSTIELLAKTGGERFFGATVDSDQVIWLGSEVGLWRYDGKNLLKPPHQNSLLNLRMNGIAHYKGNILMATLGEGVVVKSGEEIWQITERDGLASNMCNSIVVDDDELIWVSTNNGLSRVRMKKAVYNQLEIVNYSHSNGLFSSDVDEAIVIDSLVWLRNDNGLSVFNKYAKENDNPGPRVYIQQFKVNQRDTTVKDGIGLPYGQNNIQIGFAGLSYKTGNNIHYKYRLLGLDSTWQYTRQTNLIYPKLPPGDYHFDVLARDYKGKWSAKAASLTFTIHQPFWRSWWFIVACVLLTAIILQVAVIVRFRIVRNRDLLLQQSFESEQKALQAQLNPHFIFNTLGSVQDLIRSKKFELATQNLNSVARLIRKILNSSRRQYILLGDEIEGLETYLKLENLRLENKLNWRIQLAPDIDTEMTEVPPMLIQPFVENAIWHGLQGKKNLGGTIEIHFDHIDDWLCCSIKDNGVGRKKAESLRGKYDHEPLGTKIVDERIQLLNRRNKIPFRIETEDIESESGESEGTLVKIFFPMQ